MVNMLKTLKRNKKIYINELGINIYNVVNHEGVVIYDESDDFFIYFKNVNFLINGGITGRYLGSNPTSLIDDHIKNVIYDIENGWLTEDGKVIKTAKMVAVENKSGVIVIIQNN